MIASILPSISPIEEKISNGCVISESEMLIYIHVKCTEKEATNQRDKNKPFTLIWYDESQESSFMIKTTALNSIEAIVKNEKDIPLAVSVSAYPLFLPDKLKFTPDEQLSL